MLEDVQRSRIELASSGIEIALLDWGGPGPLALLHHATGFCAGMWAEVAEGLRPHYRVFAMDARGHGDSSKPEGPEFFGWEHFGRDAGEVAATLAREHGGGRVALALGHSFGGTALMVAAAQRPGLFERLVLIEPIVRPASAPDAPANSRARGGELAEAARKRRQVWPDRSVARERWSEKPMFERWRLRALDLYLAEGLRDRPDGQVELKCPSEIEAAIFDQGANSESWNLAPRVSAPTLILWAVRGNFSRPHFENLAARMPDARVVDVESGHLVPMECPDRIVEAILSEAAESEPGSEMASDSGPPFASRGLRPCE